MKSLILFLPQPHSYVRTGIHDRVAVKWDQERMNEKVKGH